MSDYVITGATGFVGGALARSLLNERHTVTALVRDGSAPVGCRVIRGELEDIRTMERIIVESRPDGVFHLAAQAIVGTAKREPFNTFESNVRGTYNLLEAVRRHDNSVPIVVASSDKAYGETRVYADGRAPYEEGDALNGRGFYDCSKSCTDLIAQSYAHSGMHVAVVRAGNIYGPGDADMSRIVPSIVDDLISNRVLNITSDGSPVRDYLYIDDAVSAYRSVMSYLGGGQFCAHTAFNFAGGEPVSVLQLVERVKDVAADIDFGRYGVINHTVLGQRTGEIHHQTLDCSKAKSTLNWHPTTDLVEGLRQTIHAAYRMKHGR